MQPIPFVGGEAENLLEKLLETESLTKVSFTNRYVEPIDIEVFQQKEVKDKDKICFRSPVTVYDQKKRIGQVTDLCVRSYATRGTLTFSTQLSLRPGEQIFESLGVVRSLRGAFSDATIESHTLQVLLDPSMTQEQSIAKLQQRLETTQAASYEELEALARLQTARFLEHGYSEADVDRAVEYIRENELPLPLFLFSTSPGSLTLTCEALFENYSEARKKLIYKDNLERIKLYKLLFSGFCRPSPFKILLLTNEPYINTRYLTFEQNKKLNELFSKCPILGTCRHPYVDWSKHLILIPDSYLLRSFSTLNKQLNVISKLTEKEPKVFFRGGCNGYPIPYTLESIHINTRLSLLEKSPALHFIDYKLSDDRAIYWASNTALRSWYETNHKARGLEFADWDTHARYRYLLSLDGHGAAWSRPQLIMATGSVLLMQTMCPQYFSSLMIAGVTHVKIEDDLSNLQSTFDYLESHPLEAQTIADNGRQFVKKYMTAQSVDTFLKIVLTHLSNSMRRIETIDFSRRITFPTSPSIFRANHLMHNLLEAEYAANRAFVINRSEELLALEGEGSDGFLIPPLTIRIWLTDPSQPKEVRADKLEFYRKSVEKDPTFRHSFWCFDPNAIPETVRTLATFNPTVEVHRVQEVEGTFICKRLIDKLLRDKLFGFASNLIRKEILYQLGGFYLDIGLEQTHSLRGILKQAKHLLYVNEAGYMDVCVMGMEAHSEFMLRDLTFISRQPELAKQMKFDILELYPQNWTTGNALITTVTSQQWDALYFARQNREFIYHGMRLWNQSPAYQMLKGNPTYFFEE